MEKLFTKVKIAHSKRVFTKPNNVKKLITRDDLNNGLTLFIDHMNLDKTNNSDKYDYLYC